jgi:D-alanyl-lipoteichoic acid acyltransferase DltB (MBOAT superfamily)
LIFQSLDYCVFLVAVLATYWLLPRRPQNLLLLAASYLFYGYVHPWFLLLILFSTAASYACARGIAELPGRRRLFLWTGVAANLALLGFFKYFHFFVDNLVALLQAVGIPAEGPALRVLLPVGISFFTFQAVSYVIDVYRGHFEARRSFLDVALFISFFPQLVAGPIERARHLLPQFEQERTFDGRRGLDGLMLLVWGFFKKLVIADNVAVIANKIFALQDVPFPLLWAGVFAFAIQILADFSAYTDIARGTGKLFGINLIENFRHPYLAPNPAEFWRRWHISLSTWLRDYVYISLGGNRVTPRREVFNVMATFLLSGLWHGAAWNFVVWGGYHGLLVVLHHRLGARIAALFRWLPGHRALAVLWMFVLTNVGWLFFRESDFGRILAGLASSPSAASGFEWEAGAFFFLLAAWYSVPLWLHAAWDAWAGAWAERAGLETSTAGRLALRTAVACTLFTSILLLRADAGVDFIYFQF